jgi:hypothetical protein
MRNKIIFNGLCLAITVGALGVAAWALFTGMIAQQGVDGLFLILVCLLIAFTFSLAPVQAIRQGLLGEVLASYRSRAAGESKRVAQAAPRRTPEET